MYPMQLERKIRRWQEAGLLAPSQVEPILAFERQNSRPWALLGFGAVGVVTIILGIIALIAANWYFISPPLKLGVHFAGYAVLAYFILRLAAAGRARWVLELLLLAWQGYVLASIALVGQIFQLSAPFYQTAAFWALLSFPTLLISCRKIVPLVWFGVIFCALIQWLALQDLSSDLAFNLLLASPFMLLLLGLVVRHARVLPNLSDVVLAFGWAFLAGVWGITGDGNGALLGQEFFRPVLPFLMMALTGLLVAIDPRISAGGKFFLTLAMLLLAGSILLMTVDGFGILRHVLAFFSAMAAAVYAALARRSTLFNVLTLFSIWQVFWVYLDLMASLVTTGIGLILTGSLILLVIWGWHRYRYNFQRAILAWNNT